MVGECVRRNEEIKGKLNELRKEMEAEKAAVKQKYDKN